MASSGRFSGTHAAWVGFSLLQPSDNWTGQVNTVEYGWALLPRVSNS